MSLVPECFLPLPSRMPKDRLIIPPAAVTMIDHQLSHASIDNDVLPCYKTASLVAEKHDGMDNVSWFAYPANRMLTS